MRRHRARVEACVPHAQAISRVKYATLTGKFHALRHAFHTHRQISALQRAQKVGTKTLMRCAYSDDFPP